MRGRERTFSIRYPWKVTSKEVVRVIMEMGLPNLWISWITAFCVG
uniref:Uncharacterized protein n=1 Tax=Anguilla anguilla TaxID=7936 RepID=A0A0E9V1A6_ANGAN